MNDHSTNGSGTAEAVSADIDAASRRLMTALDALESAVERRREADRDENELATRIQALGADRSRLADELDGSLVKSRKLERTNREIAERLDAAIGTIRSVLDDGETSCTMSTSPSTAGNTGWRARKARRCSCCGSPKASNRGSPRCAASSARSAMRA